jgi:hypothetical protein
METRPSKLVSIAREAGWPYISVWMGSGKKENCALLGYYATSSGQDSWFLKMGPKGCPEISISNYRYSLRKSPEERRAPLHGGWSLKWRQRKSFAPDGDQTPNLPSCSQLPYWLRISALPPFHTDKINFGKLWALRIYLRTMKSNQSHCVIYFGFGF